MTIPDAKQPKGCRNSKARLKTNSPKVKGALQINRRIIYQEGGMTLAAGAKDHTSMGHS